jgi:hypothetical protein
VLSQQAQDPEFNPPKQKKRKTLMQERKGGFKDKGMEKERIKTSAGQGVCRKTEGDTDNVAT